MPIIVNNCSYTDFNDKILFEQQVLYYFYSRSTRINVLLLKIVELHKFKLESLYLLNF